MRARHRLPDLLGDGQRLARQHGRLVGDADPPQVDVGVEARRAAVAERRHERVPRRLPLDVVADEARLRHVAHHQVRAARETRHLRGGGPRLLVVVLAVDERREPVARVALHAFPDVEHGAAGGVHDDAAERPQRLEIVHGDPEGGKDDHVLPRDPREIEARRAGGQDLDPHVAELPVHVRIVDDLAHEDDPPARELAPGLIGVLHRPLDPVAEAELLGQPDGHPPGLERIVVRPKEIHEAAGVVGVEGLLDLGLETEAATVVSRIGRRH